MLSRQISRDDHRVQIGAHAGKVTVTHIGSQVNHISQGRHKPVPGLLDHDDPTSWPELLRASVWGGL